MIKKLENKHPLTGNINLTCPNFGIDPYHFKGHNYCLCDKLTLSTNSDHNKIQNHRVPFPKCVLILMYLAVPVRLLCSR